jgi:hypothetical protein
MDLKRTKQLIYGTLYLVIWILIFFAVYRSFFYTAPSCFDGKQDQNETGVDCGGVCAKACIPTNLNTISAITNPSVFASSPGHYTLLGQVANANPGYAAQTFTYEFDLYDAEGTLIGIVPGESFMYSAETKYLIAPNIAVATDTVDHATLNVVDIAWTPGETMGHVPNWGPQGEPQVIGSNFASSTITVDGALTDDDLAAFNNILIVAIFKDANGNPIGASQTEVDSIQPNQTVDFSVSYPTNPVIAPALTTLYAYALRL